MKILVIGNGAREHTIVWKIAQSPKVKELFVAPGNAGTARIAQNIDIPATDIKMLAKAAKDRKIDLVVVGPEQPLAAGVVDYFESLGIQIFGPSKEAAEIEASKGFAKAILNKYNIPTGKSVTFTDFQQARDYVQTLRPPIVVKADGLAAGKGVVVAPSVEEAVAALADFMQAKKLGNAADKVLIEEFLVGREMSNFVFTDGKTVMPFVSACDYKRVFDEDKGPNTGGMGSYSPPIFDNPTLEKQVYDVVMVPAVRGMAQEGRPYRGVLYGGLMVNNDAAKVFEFNCRLGDPETQVILPRLKTDIVEIMTATIKGKLSQVKVEISDDACVGVVMASGGYPGSYKTGLPVNGLQDVDKDVMVFHAGTKVGATPWEVLTNGGRVLTVVALGKTIALARKKVYDNIARISFEGAHYRKDIALFK
ncbi:MAG TPA: phosphoribosylamine--glycine ligase [Dehalococcoidales bacterium]|nr:phosphoribosylamine--glycine ligase [Dehalococcoidales bacterium]